MRILKVNGQILDMDDATAIGITFQAYDVADPGKRKLNFSNTFTVPKTANNIRIFGHPGNPHSINNIVYDSLTCEYWEGNLHIIRNGKIRVDEVSNRLSLYIYEIKDVWEQMKLLTYADFINEFFAWLTIPKKDTPVIDTFANFLYPYTIATEGVYLPLFFSNLYGLERNEGQGDYIEDTSSIWLKYESMHGGHFGVFYKTIFKFIEFKYGVNFLTDGGILPGNIWDDTYALKFYHTFRTLDIGFHYTNGQIDGFYFRLPSVVNFAPHDDTFEMADKSLFDVVNAFLQYFNILIDNIDMSGDEVIRLARWDDIQSASVVDWSGKITGQPVFRPKIDGYAQKNQIKFGAIYPDGAETTNNRILTSLNKNLDATADLFDIDSYIPAAIVLNDAAIMDLSVPESFETNVCLIDSGKQRTVNVYASDGLTAVGATLTLNISSVYSLSGEYRFLEQTITYPKWYEVSKYLSINDIIGIQWFKQYYIKELGGSFFINKIAGFNPNKGAQSTKLELIMISDKTPVYPSTLEYWTDGVNDPWTDGTGDYFF